MPEIEEKRPVEPPKAKPRRSRRAKIFLNDIDAYLLGQEEERREAEEERLRRDQERREQLTINQTLDELLSLDPDKNKRRVRELIEDLQHFGPKSIEALKMLLSESRPEPQRMLLVMALGSFSGKNKTGAAAEELLFSQVMEAQSQRVRDVALSSLRNAGRKDEILDRSVQTYKQSVNDPNKQIYAIGVLGSIGGEEAVYRLRDILDQTDDPKVRINAIRALGEIGGNTATSILFELFDQDDTMRDVAAQALGRTNNEDVVIRLGELLWDKESPADVRMAAVRGLGSDNGVLARETLLRVLRDATQSREVHQGAISALMVGAKSAADKELSLYMDLFKTTPVEYLPQMLQPLLATGGTRVVQDLKAIFSNLNQLKKIHAIRIMARVGGDEVFGAYVAILGKEKDAAVRREILSDMASDKWKKHAPRIAAIYLAVVNQAKDKNERLTALRNLEKVSPSEAVKIAEQNLYQGENVDLCRTSIEILRRHGTNRSRDALLAFSYTDAAKGLEKQIDQAMESIRAR